MADRRGNAMPPHPLPPLIVVSPPADTAETTMFQVTADGTSKLLSVELPADPSRASLTNETIQLVADAMVAFAH